MGEWEVIGYDKNETKIRRKWSSIIKIGNYELKIAGRLKYLGNKDD